MNDIKKRSLGITLFGWILIIYFLYVLIYPIVATIALPLIDPSILEGLSNRGPAGGSTILQALGVSPVLVLILQISSLFITLILPITCLIGGILLLKLREKGRRFVIVLFSIDFVTKTLLLFLGFTNMAIKQMFFKSLSGTIFLVAFLIFDVFIIYFLTRPKTKDQFLLQTSVTTN